jgi:DNA-binding response OmpR family regulator
MLSSSLSILLVEDNPADALMVREALTEHNLDFELAIAQDCDEADSMIEKAASSKSRFDLFLIDLNLPRRPGQELLRRLRETRIWAHALVIIVTSSDSLRDREEARRLGANRYFKKPARLRDYFELGEIVKELCQEHGLV